MKLFYNSDGTVKVLPVSALPANTVWNGGFPYTPEGSLLVSIVSAKPTDTVSNGGFIQELWGGVCAGYDTPSIWIGGLAITSYGALCLDVDGGIVTDGPALYNSLTHTAIPQRAASGTTGTFTRATTATVRDNEGVLRTAIAGEARFEGARRVRNWIQSPTENWANAGWVKTNMTVSGNRLTATGANASIYDNLALGMGTERTALASITLSRVTGTGNIDISTNGGTTWTTVSVTGARVSVSLTGNINGQLAIRIVTSGDAIDATYPQLEDVTAQTTQTAGEYVSVGVESAPYYHGSFVDGVKCFPTDINGVPLTTMLGYSAEGARTNLCLQSQTFDNASWTNTNVTVTANAAVAPDGTTTADLLYPASSGVDGDRRTLQAVTSTTVAHTVSFYLKYAGFRWVMVSNTDAGANDDKNWFDVQNGVVGTIGAGTTSMSAVSVGNGWYRVSVTATNATTNCYAWVSCVDGNGSSTVTASGTNGVYAWGAQVELGSFASSYIATTTAAVTRNADVLTYSSAGNASAAAGWLYVESTVPVNNGAPQIQIDDGSNNNRILLDDGNSGNGGTRFFVQSGGAVQANIGDFSSSANTIQKRCGTWATNYAQSSQGGLLSAADTSVTTPASFTQIGVGGANGSAIGLCTIRNVRIGQRQLSASELRAITA